MADKKQGCSTRREFVGQMTGTFLAGAILGVCPIKIAAASDTTAGGEKLVAACGLYCGACPAYLASQQNNEEKISALQKQFGSGFKKEDILCDGCLGGGRVASFCAKCAMRDCAANKQHVKRCANCSEFPCSKITNFNSDGMLHHAEVLANSRQIKAMGMQKWAQHEEDRWRCSQCKNILSWYDPKCPNCGANRSELLFPLKKA